MPNQSLNLKLKRRISNTSMRRTLQIVLPTFLFLTAIMAPAQDVSPEFTTVNAQEAPTQNTGEQASADSVWRCSLDGKFYTVTNSDGVHIRAISTGQVTAELPIKSDKKGRSKMEGHWGSGEYGGLLVIQKMEAGTLSGHMLVPASGGSAYACASRKAAIIFSLGQPQPICNVVSVSWDLQPNVSTLQASQEEMQGLNQAFNSAPRQQSLGKNFVSSSVDSSLVGTWSNETATAVSYTKTRLELRADGTYTKTFGARPPTMGGGVIGATTFGDIHNGTWSVAGPMRVQLSGDSRHTPYTQDLRPLTRQ